MTKIFRYSPKDTYLILYTLFMISIPYAVAIWTPSIPWILAISFFHIWFIVNCQNSSLHHHTHWTTFYNSTANRFYEVLLSIAAGIPQNAWRHAHLLHHKYVNDKHGPNGEDTKDPVSVYRFGPDGGLNNLWTYCFKSAWIFNTKYFFARYESLRYQMPIPVHHKQLHRELWAFRLFLLSVMLINFYYGIWLCFVYFMSYVVNNANSYGEHWGALDRRGDTTQDSVGIYSTWYNIFGFNAGLHQEHHHKPGIHWTRLPEVTPLLHPDRVIVKHGVHITNNPFWSHFVALIKGEKVNPK